MESPIFHLKLHQLDDAACNRLPDSLPQVSGTYSYSRLPDFAVVPVAGRVMPRLFGVNDVYIAAGLGVMIHDRYDLVADGKRSSEYSQSLVVNLHLRSPFVGWPAFGVAAGADGGYWGYYAAFRLRGMLRLRITSRLTVDASAGYGLASDRHFRGVEFSLSVGYRIFDKTTE